jgi:hypothetical protein
LALPKSTVYYWIVDLPLGRPRRENSRKGNLAMQAKYRHLRKEAYAQGWAEWGRVREDSDVQGFVALYIAEIDGANIRLQRKSNSGQMKHLRGGASTAF